MKKTLLIPIIFCLTIAQAQLPKPFAGAIKRLDNFRSAFIQPRNVDVWLPPNYDSTKKYPVLYMHDGQMLFDSSITWNRQEWQVDEVASSLIENNKIKPCIIVGIWNNGKYRHADYFPEKSIGYLADTLRARLIKQDLMDMPLADKYLKFIVSELKPYIDSHFATLSNQSNTFIAGSSMGGLISIYAICEYPKVFGGAACLSTHWIGSTNFIGNEIPTAFVKYLTKKLPSPKKHKIYFDYGTITLDSLYKPHQLKVDNLMAKRGYVSKNWMTKEFVGEAHTEQAWSKRLYIPITFLLAIKNDGKRIH